MHIDKQSQIIVGKMQHVISDLVRENFELQERLDLAMKEKLELKATLSNLMEDYLRIQENEESYF